MSNAPFTLLYIALGGAVGSVARYLMTSFIGHTMRGDFPYSTLAVNIIGSFFMGVLIDGLARFMPAQQADIRAFVAVGILGGFTTFSAFSLDTVVLYQQGQVATALVYIAVSVILSIAALGGGMVLMRSVS